jgi:putative flavoprotein involved in K+ transport
MEKIGMMDDMVDSLPSPEARFRCNPHLSGKDGGHEINLRQLARDGVILLGHLEDIRDGQELIYAPNLKQNLDRADEFAREGLEKIDEYIAQKGLENVFPREDRPVELKDVSIESMVTMDLGVLAVKTIIWAGGYKMGFEWVKLPAFDGTGYPINRRGVTNERGLYFLGLNWLYKRKSCLLLGVGEDAAHVVSAISAELQ